jgi:hypothetical protein
MKSFDDPYMLEYVKPEFNYKKASIILTCLSILIAIVLKVSC